MLRAACMVMVLAPWVLSPETTSIDRRAHHAEVVDAMVLEEALVFRGEKRMLDQLRNLLVGHRDAALLADLGDQRAASRVHAQRHLQFDVAHGLDRGKARHEVHITTCQRVGTQIV